MKFRFLVSLGLLTSALTVQAQDSLLPDVSQYRRESLRVPITRPVELRARKDEAPSVAGESRAFVSGNRLLDALQDNAAAGVVQSPVVSLEVDGKTFDFAIVDRIVDGEFGAQHFTAVAVDSDDYARITVPNANPDDMVATIYSGSERIQVVPGAAGDAHGVLRSSKAQSLDARNSDVLRAHSGDAMVRRHVQLVELAELGATDLRTESNGRLMSVQAANLGRVSIGALGRNSGDVKSRAELADDVSDYLASMSAITLLDEVLDVEIENYERLESSSDRRQFISFVQLINGLPVGAPNRIMVEPDGTVLMITGRFAVPEMLTRDPSQYLTVETARQLAHGAVLAEFVTQGDATFSDERMFYEFTSSSAIEPFWQMVVRTADGGTFNARVNALSGEVAVGEDAIPWRQTICEPSVPGGTLGNCDSGTLIRGEVQNAQGEWEVVCFLQSKCNAPGYDDLWERHIEVREGFEQQYGPGCCSDPSSGLDTTSIVINGDRGPSYSIANDTFNYPLTNNVYEPGTINQGWHNLPVHEAWHKYTEEINPGLLDAYGLGDTGAGAIAEATADVATAVFTDPPDWSPFTGEMTPQIDRVLDNPIATDGAPKEFDNGNYNPGQQTAHRASEVISHMYYKISQKPGVSTQDIRNLNEIVTDNVAPGLAGNSQQWEPADVKRAMDDAATLMGNLDLADAIDDVWTEMGGQSSGGGSPPTTPSPVPAIFGAFQHCWGSSSVWWNWFNSVPSATTYDRYYRTFYLYPWTYAGTSPSTQGNTITVHGIEVSIRACNSVGCGGHALQTFYAEGWCWENW